MAVTADPRVLSTALAHTSGNVPVATSADTAAAVRRSLVGRRWDSAADVAVCDGPRLVGLVTIEALLAAGPEETMAALMDPAPPSVAPGTDQEVAAWEMIHRGESSLPVLDHEGRFLGLIPPVRMLAVLLAEHEEDLARVSGVLAGSRQALVASREPVGRRLLHRLPWLGVGMLGAMVSALVVGAAEDQLARTVQLAFFLPAIVYLADAVGTQTETVAVRGLSVRVPIRDVIGKELFTGLLIGLFIAVLFTPFALWLFDDPSVALAVALALLASCAVASVVALVLPFALAALGRDPAFGSGPLATVVQDLASIVIYLGLAAVLVR
jgi:magnesium transporter